MPDRSSFDLRRRGEGPGHVDADDVAEAVLAACLDRPRVARIWNADPGSGAPRPR
jgi:hypothetical protein